MPPTRARIRPNPVPAAVETPSELGSLQRVAGALLTSRQPLAFWIDPVWTVDPKPLFDALKTHADTDLAFAWPHASAPRPRTPAELTYMPADIPAVAVRPGSLRALDLPDWGPPDAVRDAATGWAMALGLWIRGGRCRAVPTLTAVRLHDQPESIPSLTPVGIAWLVAEAHSWAGQRRRAAETPAGVPNVRTAPFLVSGVGR